MKLTAARTELAAAQAEWDSLYKQATNQRQARTTAGASKNGDADNLSENAPDQITEVLRSNPSKEWDYDDINQRLPSVPRASVRVFLYKLKKDGKALKVGRGKWKAATN